MNTLKSVLKRTLEMLCDHVIHEHDDISTGFLSAPFEIEAMAILRDLDAMGEGDGMAHSVSCEPFPEPKVQPTLLMFEGVRKAEQKRIVGLLMEARAWMDEKGQKDLDSALNRINE